MGELVLAPVGDDGTKREASRLQPFHAADIQKITAMVVGHDPDITS
jgi:hypothetical protein